MAEHRTLGASCRRGERSDVGKPSAVAVEPCFDEGLAEGGEVVEVVVHELTADACFGGGSRHGDATEPGAVEESTDGFEELSSAILGSQVGTLRHRWRPQSGHDVQFSHAGRERSDPQPVGGRVVYTGAVTGLLLGEVEDLWDAVGLVEYPSLEAFQRMVLSPEMRAIEHHRAAGLAGQLNIRTRQR